ncbi:hypothetical protein [Nocardia barduliensis]|uniref:hypothetical protein n=1 Tax=Nocardia barduliensis TaxID=2736643 RepID=UPI0015723E8E|nr:hypothetical protein [Nocardia barduliensis]
MVSDGTDLAREVIEFRDEFLVWVRGFDRDIYGPSSHRDTGGLQYLFDQWVNDHVDPLDSEEAKVLFSELRPYILLAIIDSALRDSSELDFIGPGHDGKVRTVPRPLRRITISGYQPYSHVSDLEQIGRLLASMPISAE